MSHAVAYLQARSDVLAVTMHGAGRTFCAGGSPFASGASTTLVTSSSGLADSLQGFLSLSSLVVSVVCALHGAMIGGGAP